MANPLRPHVLPLSRGETGGPPDGLEHGDGDEKQIDGLGASENRSSSVRSASTVHRRSTCRSLRGARSVGMA